LEVKAFISPPTASTASAMSRAERCLGALEQQVLEEVRRPRQLGLGLVAAPTPTQAPIVTERASGIAR
jgi:hypothetical protein